MKVEFYVDIGFSNAAHREEFDYPDGTSEAELEEDCRHWKENYLNWGFDILEIESDEAFE